MNKQLRVFFQTLIIFVGIGVFVFMLWEPHLEGRNTQATVFQIYFNDPFLAFAYVGSIPFFIALLQVHKFLGFIENKKNNLQNILKSLHTIKLCSYALIGFVAVGEIFILLNDSDDRAGGVVMGLLVALVAIMMASVANFFERAMQKAQIKV